MSRPAPLLVALGLACATVLVGSLDSCGAEPRGAEAPSAAADARYVGRATCVECHPEESELWTGSDHDLAMQEATEDTVLGDFGGATHEHFGVRSTFLRRGERFVIRTDGPDGELQDHEVAYTFGVWPLQQYLVQFPRGRYQVSSLCWDARPAEEGGQRWFHLYPDEPIPSGDVLHWTGPNQNWNFMCAECHSTDLRKDYVPGEDRYDTTWAEIDVSCEACHGPASGHVEWARALERGEATEDPRKGLTVLLREEERAAWVFDPDTGIARRDRPRTSQTELETCARCHSRRGVAWGEYEHGRPLVDTHRPALLDEGLYHADGQILDEVYVYGSFLQSRMHAEGVTCSDCHDPHSLRIAGSPDAVCARCHSSERFATPEHHHHEPGTPGASCVECHMPARTYMVVDPRRDHSFRVPRPDLTLSIGAPNACGDCHADRGPAWAADAVRAWYPEGASTRPHYGEALDAGRRGAPGATESLTRLALDQSSPGIARATALSLLQRPLDARAVEAVRAGLADADPLVRLGALEALVEARGELLLELVPPLLEDPARTVRQRAAELLTALPPEAIPPGRRAAFRAALDEYVGEQTANAERGGAHLNLGNLALREGDLARAERELRLGIGIEPRYAPLHANLADLMRQRGDEVEVERVLRAALELLPHDASLHHSLGLSLVRQQRIDEAAAELRRAAELAPEVPRHGLAHGLVLEAAGRPDEALAALERTLSRHPHDRELLLALLERAQGRGDAPAALDYARRLSALEPGNAELRRLVEELEAAPR